MLIKTILNQIQRFKGFVFGDVSLRKRPLQKSTLVVEIRPRKESRPECPICGRKRPTYDTSRRAREVDYLPLWNYRVVFRYSPRRVNCPWDGIQGEWVPWVEGNEHMTHAYKIFLARWARRLSWNEVATVFETSWGCVYRAVKILCVFTFFRICTWSYFEILLHPNNFFNVLFIKNLIPLTSL